MRRGKVAKPSIRVVVVDDYEPFRRLARSTLGERPDFEIVGEVSDGLEAVRSAAELQPDLVLLDIGLPKLNGIEAARRIREQSPKSKILFFSENRLSEIVEEAMSTGAGGYLLKSDAARELFTAIEAVLLGKPFRSSSLPGHQDGHPKGNGSSPQVGVPLPHSANQIAGRHDAVFYSDDRQLIGKLAEFFGTALNAGDAAVVVATSAHQKALVHSLQGRGVDVAGAIEQGRYISLDAADAVAMCMVNGVFDPACFLDCYGTIIAKAADALNPKRGRVAAFGEGPELLIKQGYFEAAIQDERLAKNVCEAYPVDIL